MNQDRGYGQSFAPVKVGDELDIKIEAVGKKGDGIARMEGFVLFVPNTKEGDQVKIRVTRVLRNVGFAEVVGQAEGKPEEGQEEAPAEAEQASEQEEQTQEQPKEETTEQAEDTEDFGEESEEKKE